MKNMSEKDQFKSTMRTILTKAVCGKAVQTYQTTVHVSPIENVEPNRVLGCTIKNAKIKNNNFEDSLKKNIKIKIDGEFELHVWYEANGDTTIAKSTVQFSEMVPVETLEGESYSEAEFFNKRVIAWISKEPVFLGSMIVNKSGAPKIALQVEYELSIEIVGEVRINILSYLLDKNKTGENFASDDVDYDDVD